MQYVIGLDEGTTGITALLYTQKGELVGRSTQELPISFPHAGWVEQDPREIFDRTVSTLQKLLKEHGVNSSNIAALGLTNQRETSILWDKHTSEPFGPAISWQCKRSRSICQEWKNKGLEPRVRAITGLVIDSYFSASKIAWVLKAYPHTKASLSDNSLAFGTIDSWLLWNFTQGQQHATDITNASRTMLFDLDTNTWSRELAQAFDIPMSILPHIHASHQLHGVMSKKFLGHDIPIYAMVGDQHAALFAHEGTQEGLGKCTFGTGAFFLMSQGTTRQTPPQGILETTSLDAQGHPAFAHEGSVFMAGAIVQWLRDHLGIVEDAKDTEAMIANVSHDHEVVMVPAFTGLGSPYWNEDIRASLFGMSRHTTQHHVVKAAIEAIAFQVYDLVHEIESRSSKQLSSLGIDGGVTQNAYFCQFLSDILHSVIHTTDMMDMTALGAAKLATLSLDSFKSFKPNHQVKTFVPKMPPQERSQRIHQWKKAIEATLRFHSPT